MRYAILLLALVLAAAPPAAAQRDPGQAQPQWPSDDSLPVSKDWIQIDTGEWLKGKLDAQLGELG